MIFYTKELSTCIFQYLCRFLEPTLYGYQRMTIHRCMSVFQSPWSAVPAFGAAVLGLPTSLAECLASSSSSAFNSLGGTAADSQNTWVPATHLKDLDGVLGSWQWSATVGIWGINQDMEDFCLFPSPSLCLSNKLIKIIKPGPQFHVLPIYLYISEGQRAIIKPFISHHTFLHTPTFPLYFTSFPVPLVKKLFRVKWISNWRLLIRRKFLSSQKVYLNITKIYHPFHFEANVIFSVWAQTSIPMLFLPWLA